jgi:outer membrane lipoprotein carrier protein
MMTTTTLMASWLAAVAGTAAGAAAGPESPAPVSAELVLAQSEAPAEGADPLDVDTVAARVQSFYDAVQDYHADFEQTYTNAALGERLVSAGHVYFKKPGRMRWDYSTPEPKHLISNGRTLWVYEPEFQQVYQEDLSNSELPTAVRFLMGEGNLREDFEVTAGDCGERTGVHCLHLVPRASQGQYQSLDFVVSGEDFSVLETTIVDPVGNTNRFVFRNATTSDSLPEEGFEFTPTADMRVLNR